MALQAEFTEPNAVWLVLSGQYARAMKCWNLTYNDPGRWEEVYAVCGRPLSFWQSVKMGGSGSPRGVLVAAPGFLGEQLNETSYVKYCNVQRMDGGGLLYCKIRLEVYGLPLAKGDVLRVERMQRNADAFAVLIRIVLRNRSQVDIACDDRNADAWQRFLSGVFQ